MPDALHAAHTIPTFTLFVVSVGMLALAAFDVWRQEVEDYATVVLIVATVGALAWEGITALQWTTGVLSAAVVFLFYLELGLREVMGGGDVKLSVVPALALGASAPLLGLWWMAAALLIQQVFIYILCRPSALPLPHVPAMAAAVLVSSTLFLP